MRRRRPPLFAPFSVNDLHAWRAPAQCDTNLLPAKLLTLLRRHHAKAIDLFRSMGADSNGEITRGDVVRFLRRLGIDATRAEIDDFVGALEHGYGSAEQRLHGATTGKISLSSLKRALLQSRLRAQPAPTLHPCGQAAMRRSYEGALRDADRREAALREMLHAEQRERVLISDRNKELELQVHKLQAMVKELKAMSSTPGRAEAAVHARPSRLALSTITAEQKQFLGSANGARERI
jgi:hypothetical protein